MKKYGITVINELEKNVLEVALDHMQEHLEALIDFDHPNKPLVEKKLEACKNLKNSLK